MELNPDARRPRLRLRRRDAGAVRRARGAPAAARHGGHGARGDAAVGGDRGTGRGIARGDGTCRTTKLTTSAIAPALTSAAPHVTGRTARFAAVASSATRAGVGT